MKRVVLLCCVAILAQGLMAAAPATGSSQGGRSRLPIVMSSADKSAREIAAFWTEARMRRAKPMGAQLSPSALSKARSFLGESIPYEVAEVTNPSTVPEHGRAFFTINGHLAACSATVVESSGKNVVWTAAHCLYDPTTGEWAEQWAFVPAYKQNNRPFGTWAYADAFVPLGWSRDDNNEFDVGAAVMQPLNGESLEDAVGARPIAFNLPRAQNWSIFGYPGEPAPYDGEREFVCTSQTGPDLDYGPGPDMLSAGCDMGQGSSGGGWVTSGGAVASVVSAGLPGYPEIIFGPYQGAEAEDLYDLASSGTGAVTHPMKLTLKIAKKPSKLVLKGKLSATDGFAACAAGAPVQLGKVVSATQARIIKTVTTNASGAYSGKVKKKKGRYVTFAPAGPVDELNLCSDAQSPVKKF